MTMLTNTVRCAVAQIGEEASTPAAAQERCWRGCGAVHGALVDSTGLCSRFMAAFREFSLLQLQ